jgi:uncharacterized membrane protein YciS (DUF1049 family)
VTLSSRATFAIVLAIGVAGPGVANYYLAQSGYDTLGTVVWAVGYAAMVLILWYVWVRPLDIGGPTGNGP